MKTFLKLAAIAAAFGLAGAAANGQAPASAPAATTAANASATVASTAATNEAAPAVAANSAAPAADAAANDTAAAATNAAADAPAYPAMAPTPGIGQPDGRAAIPDQVTPIGEEAAWFHNSILMPLITGICLLVLFLLIWVIFRYRSGANPNPTRTSHNTVLEVVWTLVPVLILVAIAIPSIRLLAHQYSPPDADLTVKVIGNQWYWEYEYPDNGIHLVSNILTEEQDRERGEPRQLGVDQRLVVPAGKTVKVIVTSNDVIHSWGVPAFWVKIDAVPGRLNETWFRVDRPGVYYGVCYELCGARHGYMPIAVEVVPPAQFERWVASQGGHMAGAQPAEAAAPAAAATEGTAATPAPSNTVQAAEPAQAQTSQTN
jgi:cytochrome c oxidase subunit 2